MEKKNENNIKENIVTESKEEPKKKNVCNEENCRRKLKGMPFDCRCGGEYCAKHRLSDDHNCTFDYKAYNRTILRIQLVKIEAEKIIKI